MRNKKQLKFKTTVEVDGNVRKAKCSVAVYEMDGGLTEVVLSKPDDANYAGGSTTNFFERFATKIKATLLKDIPHGRIIWKDHQYWECFKKATELKVKMNFDGKTYSHPLWGGK